MLGQRSLKCSCGEGSGLTQTPCVTPGKPLNFSSSGSSCQKQQSQYPWRIFPEGTKQKGRASEKSSMIRSGKRDKTEEKMGK